MMFGNLLAQLLSLIVLVDDHSSFSKTTPTFFPSVFQILEEVITEYSIISKILGVDNVLEFLQSPLHRHVSPSGLYIKRHNLIHCHKVVTAHKHHQFVDITFTIYIETGVLWSDVILTAVYLLN